MTMQAAPINEAPPEEPHTEHRARALWLVIAAVFGLVVGGLAVWALSDSTDDALDPRLEKVTELVDTMHEGLNADDPEQAASVFTEDGDWLWEGSIGLATSDMENALSAGLSDWERVSEVTEVGDEHYTFVQQFRNANDEVQRSIVVIELDGDLVSQAQYVPDFYNPEP